jgi:hypothetical protein
MRLMTWRALAMTLDDIQLNNRGTKMRMLNDDVASTINQSQTTEGPKCVC